MGCPGFPRTVLSNCPSSITQNSEDMEGQSVITLGIYQLLTKHLLEPTFSSCDLVIIIYVCMYVCMYVGESSAGAGGKATEF